MRNSAITQTRQTEITKGQKRQLKRFLIDAVQKMDIEELLEELEMEKESVQRIIERGGLLSSNIKSATKEAFIELSLESKYPEEEVESNYGYISGYVKPRGINEQYRILEKNFKVYGLPNMDVIFQPTELPTEGWFLIPKWEAIAKTYTEAVYKVMAKIKRTGSKKVERAVNRTFCLGSPNHIIKETQEKMDAMGKMNVDQGGRNYTVIPAQFGIRHRGRSHRKAKEEHFLSNEFSLGLFEIGIMILTHPERLKRNEDLFIICGGDCYHSRYKGASMRVPVLTCENESVFLDEYWNNNAYEYCGAATAFFQ